MPENKKRIAGIEVLTPRISKPTRETIVAEMEWCDENVQPRPISVGIERTLTSRAGFLCEPHFYSGPAVPRTLRCVGGEVCLVIFDVRRGSPTFRQVETITLAADDLRIVKIPTDLACGYVITSPSATLEERLSRNLENDWQWIDWRDEYLHAAWPEKAKSIATHKSPSVQLNDIPYERLPQFVHETNREQIVIPSASDTIRIGFRVEFKKKVLQESSPETRSADVVVPKFQPLSANAMIRSSSDARQELILVLGCEGQLGRDLVRELRPLGKIIGASHRGDASNTTHSTAEVDFRRPASLRQTIRDVRPTLIVNACALTDIDTCESRVRDSQLINATAPMLLAEEARKLNVPIVHYCTSYVYGGEGTAAWRESDATRPTCQYAHTKALGSEAIQHSNARHLILRTNWLYSTHSDNFMRTTIDQAQKRDTIKACCEQIGTPTPSAWLATITATLLKQAQGQLIDWLNENGGLLHATPLGFASRVEITEQILRSCRDNELPLLARTVRSRTLNMTRNLIPTPANCRLDCSKILGMGISLPPWQRLLAEQVQLLAQSKRSREEVVAA